MLAWCVLYGTVSSREQQMSVSWWIGRPSYNLFVTKNRSKLLVCISCFWLLDSEYALIHCSFCGMWFQQVIPGTQNEKLRGRVFYPRDKAIMDLNDPYMTTNNKVHRRFTDKELDSYPRKDGTTYWECEEYPKAWGFGQKHKWVGFDSFLVICNFCLTVKTVFYKL